MGEEACSTSPDTPLVLAAQAVSSECGERAYIPRVKPEAPWPDETSITVGLLFETCDAAVLGPARAHADWCYTHIGRCK